MSVAGWVALMGSAASLITAVALLLAVLGIGRRVRDVHEAVETSNGQSLGQLVEQVATERKPWDGTERRVRHPHKLQS